MRGFVCARQADLEILIHSHQNTFLETKINQPLMSLTIVKIQSVGKQLAVCNRFSRHGRLQHHQRLDFAFNCPRRCRTSNFRRATH